MNNDERNELLRKFLCFIIFEDKVVEVEKILREVGVNLYIDEILNEFYFKNYYYFICKYCF